MNPPFRLGPTLAFRPEASPYRLDPPDPSLSYHQPFEVSAGVTLAPRQNVEAQTQISWLMHPRFFLRLGFASDFSERILTSTLQAGTRVPLTEFLSLDISAIGGFAGIVGQERQQGQLAEVLQRTGFTYYLGGEVRLNAEISHNFGAYGAAAYLREFCGDINITPNTLPVSGNRGICEDDNIVAFSAGLRFRFGASTNPIENRQSDEERYTRPPSYSFRELPPEHEIEALTLSEMVSGDIVRYIQDLHLITHQDVEFTIEEVANHSRFNRLPGDLQKIVILNALRGNSVEALKILSNELFIIHQDMQRNNTYDAIETGIRQVREASGIPLDSRTLQHLRGLRQNARTHHQDLYVSYLDAITHLSTACLHHTLASFAQSNVRRYILQVAREANIQSGDLENFHPSVISYSEASVSAVCHIREALAGCATTDLPLNQQGTYISLSSTSPLSAYETIIHENMHLFSALSRRNHGCNDSNSYSLRGQNYNFPFWMEEGLNQYNTHLLLSSQNLIEAYEYEPNSAGRQAIEATVTHLGNDLSLHWRSMHLFCRADEAKRDVGGRLFQRLTTGYDPHDFRGTAALQRVDRYFSENPTSQNSSDNPLED